MLAEQTLPGIAGYFAAMLYNPNNVSADAAPVTVTLELEAGRMLSNMIGYGSESWAHLCSGGTAANIEALWAARAVKYLPLITRDLRRGLELGTDTDRDIGTLLGMSPTAAMEEYAALWRVLSSRPHSERLIARAHEITAASRFNLAERGAAAVYGELGSMPVLLVPESRHYCFEKAMDILGLGRHAVIAVGVDKNFRMRAAELERTITQVTSEGKHVLAVVGVVGSTEEGSIDPLDEIVALRDRREKAGASSFWLHADGAYGGYLRTVTLPTRAGLGPRQSDVKLGGSVRSVALELPEHGECSALEAMSACDSVTIDPHKLGYIPYPAGAICFRNNLVKPLLRQTAAYIDDAPGTPDTERHSESIGLYVLEGSKPGASAAAVWLSHTLIPLDTSGHGRLMKENIRNACELHALLEGYPQLAEDSGGMRAVCLCPPGSNIVCYAFAPRRESASLRHINSINRRIFERFSVTHGMRIYEQSFFVSRTALSEKQYSVSTVGSFLERLRVTTEDYSVEGVFLLRSVTMNPWYSYAKRRGRYYLSEMVTELYRAAEEEWAATKAR
jgi:glutamate/tyrosine decarboxylase-like PLP-dependent enzyme